MLGTRTYPLIIVEGNSMSPGLLNGDILVYRGVDPGDITNGTVVAYMPGQTGIPALDYLVRPIIVHRVIGEVVQEDGVVYYRTKGDNNQFNDPVLVRSDQVLGTPAADVPILGVLILFLKSPQGLVFLVAAAVFFYMAKYDRERQNDKNKKEFVAILARMLLNGELSPSQFEGFKVAIEFGEELPSRWLKNPVHASLADWIKSGGLSNDWTEEPAKCPKCLQAATMIKGTKDFLLICPRCSEQSDASSPSLPIEEPSEPFVKHSLNEGTTRGVTALVVALGRLIRRKTRTGQEIGS